MKPLLDYLAALDLIGVLSIGSIGLGFLLALLTVFLAVSRNDGRLTYIFMAFAIALIALGMASQYMSLSFDKAAMDLRKRIEELTTQNAQLIQSEAKAVAALAQKNNEWDAAKGEILTQIISIRGVSEQCRHEADGASTNTSDAGGCTTAARRAIEAGRAANEQLDVLRGRVEGLQSAN